MYKRKATVALTMVVLALALSSSFAFAKQNQNEGQPFKELWEAVNSLQSSTGGLLEAIQSTISEAVIEIQTLISDAVVDVQTSIEGSEGVVTGEVSGAKNEVLDEVELTRNAILDELADKPKIFAETASCTLTETGITGEIEVSSTEPFVVKALYVIPEKGYLADFDLRWPSQYWVGSGAIHAYAPSSSWTDYPVLFNGIVYDADEGFWSGVPFEYIRQLKVDRDELSFPGGWRVMATYDVQGISADTVLRVQVVVESAQDATVTLSVSPP